MVYRLLTLHSYSSIMHKTPSKKGRHKESLPLRKGNGILKSSNQVKEALQTGDMKTAQVKKKQENSQMP